MWFFTQVFNGKNVSVPQQNSGSRFSTQWRPFHADTCMISYMSLRRQTRETRFLNKELFGQFSGWIKFENWSSTVILFIWNVQSRHTIETGGRLGIHWGSWKVSPADKGRLLYCGSDCVTWSFSYGKQCSFCLSHSWSLRGKGPQIALSGGPVWGGIEASYQQPAPPFSHMKESWKALGSEIFGTVSEADFPASVKSADNCSPGWRLPAASWETSGQNCQHSCSRILTHRNCNKCSICSSFIPLSIGAICYATQITDTLFCGEPAGEESETHIHIKTWGGNHNISLPFWVPRKETQLLVTKTLPNIGHIKPLVSDRVFHVFGAVRNFGFQNMIRKTIRELSYTPLLHGRKGSMGEEKASFLTIMKKKTTEINLGWLKLSSGKLLKIGTGPGCCGSVDGCQPANWKVASLIPSQGTGRGGGPGPQ